MISVAQETQPTPSGLPLEVIDSTPFVGEELGLSKPIELFFDRPIDCGSLSAGDVQLLPVGESTPVTGTVTCNADRASLTFTPEVELPRATAYQLVVSPAALTGIDGAVLGETYSLDLNTTGFLTVSDVLPADEATEIAPDSTITIIFNRPVVPLVIAEDTSTLPSPITITPKVDGQGEWINTSIYMFKPDIALAGGTSYTVSTVPGLTATDGAVLQSPLHGHSLPHSRR